MNSKVYPEEYLILDNKDLRICYDVTQIKVGYEFVWLWVAIESKTKNIVVTSISKERNMLVAEKFLPNIVKENRKYPVSTDGGT